MSGQILSKKCQTNYSLELKEYIFRESFSGFHALKLSMKCSFFTPN